jgi:hypothetical protein
MATNKRVLVRSRAVKLHCSFCGKSNDEVAKLVAGPNVFICNECHASMADLMSAAADAPPAPEPPPYDRFSWRFAIRKLVGDNDGKLSRCCFAARRR